MRASDLLQNVVDRTLRLLHQRNLQRFFGFAFMRTFLRPLLVSIHQIIQLPLPILLHALHFCKVLLFQVPTLCITQRCNWLCLRTVISMPVLVASTFREEDVVLWTDVIELTKLCIHAAPDRDHAGFLASIIPGVVEHAALRIRTVAQHLPAEEAYPFSPMGNRVDSNTSSLRIPSTRTPRVAAIHVSKPMSFEFRILGPTSATTVG
mmetsp:Transcript_56804/g.116314  ORF Transcript_56804/g.116314 Transcript_56804/m.116314 type:complete len:207 (-) Transcript_56804:141-761(-)